MSSFGLMLTRSLVLLPDPRGLAFGFRVAFIKISSTSERRGFVPRLEAGRLLLHRQTSSRKVIVLTDSKEGEPWTSVRTAPVELSSVPWAVDYGQEVVEEIVDKVLVPWDRFETPEGNPFCVHLPTGKFDGHRLTSQM